MRQTKTWNAHAESNRQNTLPCAVVSVKVNLPTHHNQIYTLLCGAVLKLWGVSSPFKGFLISLSLFSFCSLRTATSAAQKEWCWVSAVLTSLNRFCPLRSIHILWYSYVNKSTYTCIVQYWSSDSIVSCGAAKIHGWKFNTCGMCTVVCWPAIAPKAAHFLHHKHGHLVCASRCRLVLNQEQIEIMVTLHVRFVMGTCLQLSNSHAWSWKSLWSTDTGVIHTRVWDQKKQSDRI